MNDRTDDGIKISTFADLVCKKKPDIVYIPLRELHDFKNHPFKVVDDKRMMNLVESIKNDGVLVPGIVRPRDGEEGYEIISGHRRKHACELAGILTMPVIIKKMDDDQAVLEMIKANLQREEVLPSEKAFSFKMELEVLKRKAGRPSKENSCQVDTNFRADEELAKNYSESASTIQRYIRLTQLDTGLLDMVDEKKIKFNPAVELSYLKHQEQKILLEEMEENNVVPSLNQAQQLKKLSQDNAITKESVHAILVVAISKERKITLKQEIIYRYFNPDTSDDEIESIICGLLDEWKKKGGSL